MTGFVLFDEPGTTLKNPKYQILKNREGKYFFRLFARNGEIILNSRDFDEKQSCLSSLDAIRLEGNFNFVEMEDLDKNLFYFEVTNHNQKLVGTSEMYTTKIGRGNGIMSVMKIICDAPSEDLTD